MANVRLEEALEAAYWSFDSRRAGNGQWNGRPQIERDAFKGALRMLLATWRQTEDGEPEAVRAARAWIASADCSDGHIVADVLAKALLEMHEELGDKTAMIEDIMREYQEVCGILRYKLERERVAFQNVPTREDECECNGEIEHEAFCPARCP